VILITTSYVLFIIYDNLLHLYSLLCYFSFNKINFPSFPDYQYMFNFFTCNILNNFSFVWFVLSINVGFQLLSVVVKLIYSSVIPQAYRSCLLPSSNLTWTFIIFNCKLSIIFFPNRAIIPSYFLSSFIFFKAV
jgi:hypothetical protein